VTQMLGVILVYLYLTGAIPSLPDTTHYNIESDVWKLK